MNNVTLTVIIPIHFQKAHAFVGCGFYGMGYEEGWWIPIQLDITRSNASNPTVLYPTTPVRPTPQSPEHTRPQTIDAGEPALGSAGEGWDWAGQLQVTGL